MKYVLLFAALFWASVYYFVSPVPAQTFHFDNVLPHAKKVVHKKKKKHVVQTEPVAEASPVMVIGVSPLPKEIGACTQRLKEMKLCVNQ